MKTYNYPGNVFKISESVSELIEQMKEKPSACAPIVAKYSFKIKAEAARDSPVEFGALKNSWINYPSSNPLTWYVEDGVFYGIFQELGTSRGVTAKHMLGGAVERNRDEFLNEITEALKI